tara:strand:+ start:3285 stop:3500 length:216 start_codon:yes stop_codon:yes gene_type:complete
MPGDVCVRVIQKSYRQLEREKNTSLEGSRSIDVIYGSELFRCFETHKEAWKFANRMREEGYHIISIENQWK